jgi:hypothetical protein
MSLRLFLCLGLGSIQVIIQVYSLQLSWSLFEIVIQGYLKSMKLKNLIINSLLNSIDLWIFLFFYYCKYLWRYYVILVNLENRKFASIEYLCQIVNFDVSINTLSQVIRNSSIHSVLYINLLKTDSRKFIQIN